MRQQIAERHLVDDDGNPAGGKTTGTGIEINWQNGPLGRGEDRKEPNGAFVEGTIDASIGRLQFYETVAGGKFSCEENREAIRLLRQALGVLEARTKRREDAEIEGTHKEG